ncbi:phosphoheptose isomerase [Candidatus Pelagibacter sp.]|nr:phosphoheptose isomerase [Candidatus Pelagibacter sp.]
MKKKIIFCFDLDNVICTTNKSEYQNSKPNKKAINVINKLYKEGYCIKIFTARYMGRNNDNIIKARKQGKKLTKMQLKKWKVKFTKLIMGKPSYDIFVDDKAYGFKKSWINNIEKKYLKV